MKKFLLLAALIAWLCPGAQAQILGENMIEDFETNRHLTYGFSNGTLMQPVSNSVSGTGNTSAFIGDYTRNAGAQYDVVVTTLDGPMQDIASYLSNSKKFTMKVYTNAPIGTNVQLTVQNTALANTGYPNGSHSVYQAITTKTGQWETLVFDYLFQPSAGTPTTNLNQLVISFNNSSFTGYHYYFDDLAGPVLGGVSSAITRDYLWANFKSSSKIKYVKSDGVFSVEQNPSPSAADNSDSVAQYVRSHTQYDIVSFSFDALLSNLSDYRDNTRKFSLRIFSPAAGTTVQFTLQDSTKAKQNYPAGRFGEFTGVTTTSNQWETVVLTWVNTPDGAVAASSVDQLAILINSGSFNQTTVYLDSIYGPTMTAIPHVTKNEYLWTNYNTVNHLQLAPGVTDGTFSNVSNPHINSSNTSSNVAKYVRSNAQYDVLMQKFDASLSNLANYKANTSKFTIKVFSPAAGTSIQFTLQDSTAAKAGYPTGRYSEFVGTTTKTNQWEWVTLSWVNTPDASVTDAKVNELAILFNSGTFANVTMFIDSIYGPTMVPNPAITTEYLWSDWNGVNHLVIDRTDGAFAIVNNPARSTANNSVKSARYIRSGNQYDNFNMAWGGTLKNLSGYIAGTRLFKIKVFSPAVGTTVQFTLQDSVASQNGYPTGRYAEFVGTTTKHNAWETITLSYSGTPDPSVTDANVNQAAVLINSGTFAPVTTYFDSIYGPTIVPAPPVIVTNDHLWANFGTVNHTKLRYHDGTFSTVANPAISAANSSATVGQYVRSGVQYDNFTLTWGATLNNLSAYRSNLHKFRVKVYSPAAGTKIQFTLQDSVRSTQGYPNGRYGEFTGTTTTTNQWETVVLKWVNTPDGSVADASVNEMAILINSGTFSPVTVLFDSLYGPTFSITLSGTQSSSGTFQDVTVLPTGVLNLSGNLEITGSLNLQSGATINTNCHAITGSGNFFMQPNTTLSICDPNGISTASNMGAVRVTGTRGYASTANYIFNGTAAQVTGDGFPAQLGNLTINNAAGVSLTSDASVSGTVTFTNGKMDLNGNNFKIQSTATGTGRVATVPSGSGFLNATNFTVERWLDPGAIRSGYVINGAYYWVGSTVTNQTVDSWNTASNPYVSTSYDGGTTHGSVWLYDNTNNITPANGGWIKPAAANIPLSVGQGARVWFNNSFFTAGAVASLTASPVVGDFSLPVSYCNGTCAGNASTNGWNLVSNPYPSTIDWNSASWTKTNMADALYIWKHNTNSYSSYIAGVGTNGGTNLIAMGQGFLVEATNSNPVLMATENVKSAANGAMLRTAATSLLRLKVTAANSFDEAVIVNRANAVPAFEASVDARKFYNPNVNIWAEPIHGSMQSIASMALNAGDSISIKLQSNKTETVSLSGTDFTDLSSRFNLFIRDEVTGSVTPFDANTNLSLVLTASRPYSLTLLISPLSVTAVASKVKLAFNVAPNPGNGTFTISSSSELKSVEIIDALGRVAYVQELSGNIQSLNTGLPAGIYTAKVSLGGGSSFRKIVIE